MRFGWLGLALVWALAGCEEIEEVAQKLPPPPPSVVYHAPGDLVPETGQGAADFTVYAPDIAFPVRSAPAFLNSQVNNPGGMNVAGDQCDTRNYQFPWRDTFCENRSANRSTFNCATKRVHQGVDIRAGDPSNCLAQRRLPTTDHRTIEVVAVDHGVISYVGSYSVELRAGGRVYRYLHLNPQSLQVRIGQAVFKGQVIGHLSNAFGSTPTTLHLHFEVKQNMEGVGFTWVSPYMTLVQAYERREGRPGSMIPRT
jgi:murein DD-endopeptidase MepM/ murein hydrolase activator NlpD